MAENSKIEWTDHTFNPWMGCTKVSPACANCYAERDMDHRYGKVAWGPKGTRVITSDANWQKPKQWDRQAENLGIRYRVFCASLADVFEDWQGPILSSGKSPVILSKDYRASTGSDRLTMEYVRLRLFSLIDATPNLDWLLLTKRPENIRKMWVHPSDTSDFELLTRKRYNVWLGTSVENQEYADKRIPELLKCRDLSPVLFLSCEPLLGPVDLWPAAFKDCPGFEDTVMDPTTGLYECCQKCDYSGTSDEIAIGWVITGGESGPSARPAHPDWYRSLRDQCEAAGVPFHFKQWGEWAPGSGSGFTQWPEIDPSRPVLMPANPGREGADQHQVMVRVGKKAAGRILDGRTHDGLPARQLL